jgi:3-hydroxybutyrate dehydrogenase/3-oxoacyl-[acyl-carrier protein] reductase
MGDLDGKVAAVTGGTRGIGLAIAKAFHREGASVVVNGRSPEKGAAALEEMGGGDRVHYIAADVKTREGVESIIDGTVEQFGRIDILVNNAGGAANHAPVAQLTDEAFGDALVWNLWSTFWGMRRALHYMIPQQWGRIINISSVEGKHGKPGVAIYVTAKHAINGLTKSCAQEVGTLGITVNALCPGAIETDVMMAEGPGAAAAMGLTYQGLLDSFAEEAAIKRLNTCEEVAEVAVLVASDIGGGITGSQISIDGGTAAF